MIHVCCVGANNGFQMAPQSGKAVPQNVEALPILATTVTVDWNDKTRTNIQTILTHLAYIANGKKTCYIVQQFHWANKRDVTLRHL